LNTLAVSTWRGPGCCLDSVAPCYPLPPSFSRPYFSRSPQIHPYG
jgi:hypothetical protein